MSAAGSTEFLSWGRYPREYPDHVHAPWWRHEELPRAASLLPRGCGRSYGDSCLNAGGTLIHTARLDRVLDFDRERGVVRCESGMTLARLLDLVVPSGWFPPVMPGTRHVSIGGAIANDVHGKNHHVAGSFGRHVLRFELARSDGARLECSPDMHEDLFAATIGGLGLTGLVTWAEIALKPIRSANLDMETIAFAGIGEFLALSRESNERFEHTVAWIDSTQRRGVAGRGLFMRANPVDEPDGSLARPVAAPRLRIPFDFPAAALSRTAMSLFNALHYRAARRGKRRVHYAPFFHPLDGIGDWNRIYGARGLLQHQCVVPLAEAPGAVAEMLGAIASAGEASFLSVLKVFGDRPSPGMLSFPRPGVTLALDFPVRAATLDLLDRLDRVVMEAGGAVYPAKDARMSPATFAASFPRVGEFARHVDPAFSSSFWRRVRRDG
jgi:FAD/FMN-containing dehydrogenase